MTSEAFRNNPLFLRNQFAGDGVFEMPMIRRQHIDLKDLKLLGYDQIKPNDRANAQSFIHFFLDDYKFEVMWNDPEPRLEKLSQYKGVLSPQFSTYYTMPISLQINNTFRSRWCGAYFQSKGLTVIPTVYWGRPQSYWYCFDGIEKGSVVALSTLGVKKEKDFFLQGYNEMLRRLEPKAIVCYCEPFPEMEGNIIKVDYAQTNNLGYKKSFYGFINKHSSETAILQLPETQQKASPYYVVKTGGYVIAAGFGGGGLGVSDGESQNNNAILEKINKLARQIRDRNGSPPPGYKGGKQYRNQPKTGCQKLPDGVRYKEYDINPYSKGIGRDQERIVIGDDGSIWYTDDHYHTFTRIN